MSEESCNTYNCFCPVNGTMSESPGSPTTSSIEESGSEAEEMYTLASQIGV